MLSHESFLTSLSFPWNFSIITILAGKKQLVRAETRVEGEWGCKSYGCLFLGRNVLEHSWPLAKRVFAIDPKSPPLRAQTSNSATEGRYQNILRMNWKRFWKQQTMP